MIAMQDAAKILGCYAVTVAGVIGYAVYTLRKGRQLAAQVRAEDRPWT